MESSQQYSFFSQPKILSGSRALENIPAELKSYGSARPLVVIGQDHACLKKTIIKAFSESDTVPGAMCALKTDSARWADIRILSDMFSRQQCDSIIAIGGGVSRIARGLNMRVSGHAEPSSTSAPGKLHPFVYVTTCDSEDAAAGKSAHVDGIDYISDALYPDIICIDRRTARASAFKSSIGTAFAALTHAVEASSSSANPVRDAYAHAAIPLIVNNSKILAKKSSDGKAATGLMNGVAMAGIALANSEFGAAHYLATALADMTGTDAGMLMGLLLSPSLGNKILNGETVREELLLPLAGIDEYCAVPSPERAHRALNLIASFIRLFDSQTRPARKSLERTDLFNKAAASASTASDGRLSEERGFQILIAASREQ